MEQIYVDMGNATRAYQNALAMRQNSLPSPTPQNALSGPQGSTRAVDIAGSALGLNEGDKAAALNDFLTTGGQNLDPQTTAWCAAFVNSAIQQSGGEGTGSNMARSFLNWGQGVDTPEVGDLAVFSRGDPGGPYGHVGFYQGTNADGTIRVLGGNQSNAVSIANYSPNALLGYRRG